MDSILQNEPMLRLYLCQATLGRTRCMQVTTRIAIYLALEQTAETVRTHSINPQRIQRECRRPLEEVVLGTRKSTIDTKETTQALYSSYDLRR